MQAEHPHFWGELCRLFQTAHPELYRAWFEELEPGGIFGGQIRIRVPDSSRAAYLTESCAKGFTQLATSLTGHLVSVSFQSPEPVGPRPTQAPRFSAPANGLNADYTFDEFVVGVHNRLAHAACRAAAAQPGISYNPIFLHGTPGLGKSHLLQAACAEIQRTRPELSVIYCSCETFINAYVGAIADLRVEQFRECYRTADVLAMDDVQFLSGSEATHDEFFHTFNTLYQGHRQILLSADAMPRELPKLEDRLKSRFSWGLVAPLEPPDHETRRAILSKKAQLRGYQVSDELLDLIATRVDSNVRLLEGALTKCVSQATLAGIPLTTEMVQKILDELCGPRAPDLQISDILEMVASYYKIKVSDLVGKKRTRSVVEPRHVGMYLARNLTQLSLGEIGSHFGGRDHSTVLHAERAIEEQRKHRRGLDQAVNLLKERLEAKR